MTRKQQRKQPLTTGNSMTLPRSQQRAVIALGAQRERVVSEANQTLTEIGEALTELALLYATKAGLPEDAQYIFEQRGQAIVLVRLPVQQDQKPEEAERKESDE